MIVLSIQKFPHATCWLSQLAPTPSPLLPHCSFLFSRMSCKGYHAVDSILASFTECVSEPFKAGFFYLAFESYPASIAQSFLLLSSIPAIGSTTVCSSLHLVSTC